MNEAKYALIAYGLKKLASVTGGDAAELLSDLGEIPNVNWKGYEALLGGSGDREEALSCIFSRIARPDKKGQRTPPKTAYYVAQRLALNQKVLFPCLVKDEDGQERLAKPREAREASDLPGLWQGFKEECKTLLERFRSDQDGFFEGFYHLYHKYAWAVPCTYGEPAVSLFQQWKAVAALVFATGEKWADGPAGDFTLIGGDIPGIQDFVYTITSKGAAKGLRGRSFFIQLLSDAVARRLLADLGLPETSVIYAAGGNFMLLAPAGFEKQIDEIDKAINQELLAAFEGDLALCLACEPLYASEVGNGVFSIRASRALKDKIALQKRRRFADLAEEDWDTVFGPQGQGGVRFCSVCQHERRSGEKGWALEDGGWKCDQCHGFEELAQTIAQDYLLMFVSDQHPRGPAKGWQDLLWRLTSQWYDFRPDLKRDMPADTRVYSINYLDFLSQYAHGFRLIANTTPREANGQVRTFEDLAEGAVGLKRVGVLRMDVDDLGRVLTQWMPERTMASTSALSLALDCFFAGWLDGICREVMADPQMKGIEKGRDNLLYVIYAGGDDLFVVGAWDLMPLLAERVQKRFAAYVGRNPYLHISAGITLEDRKFPLYQAAERAGEALDRGAKEQTRQVKGRKVKKNAISFLSQVMGWEKEAYPSMRELTERLIWLIQDQRVPRSLLSVMSAIYSRYKEDVRQARERRLEDTQIYYGPWMWRKVYQLSRIKQRYEQKESGETAQAIGRLETKVLTPKHMSYVGLAARWAEYLTRREE